MGYFLEEIGICEGGFGIGDEIEEGRCQGCAIWRFLGKHMRVHFSYFSVPVGIKILGSWEIRIKKMHWAFASVFYHIYPLGFCGAPERNDFYSLG